MTSTTGTDGRSGRRYAILDVFTDKPLSGNPLAVVLDSEGLDGPQMHAIAKEFNLSETVFVLPPEGPAHSAKLRIFTPATELPFAGHPTVGTAVLLGLERWPDGVNEGMVLLEEEVGSIRCGVDFHNDGRTRETGFAEFDIPKVPEAKPWNPDIGALSDALGLNRSQIGFDNHKPSAFSAGLHYRYIPVRNLDAMRDLKINMRAFRQLFDEDDDHNGAYVYCRECVRHDSDFHARMFSARGDLREDPATGSAAAGFAGPIAHFDTPVQGLHKFVVEQGFEMGRESLITLEIETKSQGKAISIARARIGGSAVVVARGELLV